MSKRKNVISEIEVFNQFSTKGQVTKTFTFNLVKETILSENIDILCMQEAEISFNLDHNLLSFPGYLIETESNSQSSRVAFYVNKRINYNRRRYLEGRDSNIIILDLAGPYRDRLINIYRSFSPQHNISQRDKFCYQL